MDKKNAGTGVIPFCVVAGLCGLILIKHVILQMPAPGSFWACLSGDVILLLIVVPIIFYTCGQSREKQAQVNRLTLELRQLSSDLLLSNEKERRKIAMDLHDRIGQNLSLSRKKIDVLRDESGDPAMASSFDDILGLLDQTISDTRSLTFDISPHILYDEGLEGALDWLCEETGKGCPIRFEFHDDLKPKPLSMDSRILLYRCIRELVINVVKHSDAKHARINIGRDGNDVNIQVDDDGIGCVPANRDDINRRFGLSSVREQVNHYGGDFCLESAPGRGTSVTIRFPIDHID